MMTMKQMIKKIKKMKKYQKKYRQQPTPDLIIAYCKWDAEVTQDLLNKLGMLQNNTNYYKANELRKLMESNPNGTRGYDLKCQRVSKPICDFYKNGGECVNLKRDDLSDIEADMKKHMDETCNKIFAEKTGICSPETAIEHDLVGKMSESSQKEKYIDLDCCCDRCRFKDTGCQKQTINRIKKLVNDINKFRSNAIGTVFTISIDCDIMEVE